MIIISMMPHQEYKIKAMESGVNEWSRHNYSLGLSIYLSPEGLKERTEVLQFDALDLVGNIGGFLGLLLGWSALSVLEASLEKLGRMAKGEE